MNRPMSTDGLVRHRFSGSDVDRMIESGILDADGRWELIDGEIVPMAAQHLPHSRMVVRLTQSLIASVDAEAFEVVNGATVELGPQSRVDPDVSVIRSGLSCEIVPASELVLVIEVADASRSRDLRVKAPLYAVAGVPEYWVVDLETQSTHVHRGPSAQGWLEPVLVVPFADVLDASVLRSAGFKLR